MLLGRILGPRNPSEEESQGDLGATRERTQNLDIPDSNAEYQSRYLYLEKDNIAA